MSTITHGYRSPNSISKNEFLLSKLSLLSGTNADLESIWLMQETGRLSGATGDLWNVYMDAQLQPPGHVQQRIYNWLELQGFAQKQYEDRFEAFWKTGIKV